MIFSTRCHCYACGQRFANLSAIERHRVGDHGARRCGNAVELQAAGLVLLADHAWTLAR